MDRRRFFQCSAVGSSALALFGASGAVAAPALHAPTAPAAAFPCPEKFKGEHFGWGVGVGLVRWFWDAEQSVMLHRIVRLRWLLRMREIEMPLLRVRDLLDLGSDEYRIVVRGRVVAAGEVRPQGLLAIETARVKHPLPGEIVPHPVTARPSVWIEPQDRHAAAVRGYEVVGAQQVVIAHLEAVAVRYRAELRSKPMPSWRRNTWPSVRSAPVS